MSPRSRLPEPRSLLFVIPRPRLPETCQDLGCRKVLMRRRTDERGGNERSLPCEPRFLVDTALRTGRFDLVPTLGGEQPRVGRGFGLFFAGCGRGRAFPHPPPASVAQPELVPPQIAHPGVASDDTLTSHPRRGRNEC